jgi:hypothetical protein
MRRARSPLLLLPRTKRKPLAVSRDFSVHDFPAVSTGVSVAERTPAPGPRTNDAEAASPWLPRRRCGSEATDLIKAERADSDRSMVGQSPWRVRSANVMVAGRLAKAADLPVERILAATLARAATYSNEAICQACGVMKPSVNDFEARQVEDDAPVLDRSPRSSEPSDS